MQETNIRTELVNTLSECGIAVGPGEIDRLACHWELVEEANSRFNLTAIKREDAASKHYADCLLALPALDALGLPAGARVLDIGSGAGFPGLVLAIVRPELRFSLLEATGKKADFLRGCAEALGLDNVEVITSRAEELGHSERRACFDAALARAVAALPVLAEYAVPLLKQGGSLLAMKGANWQEEVEAAGHALAVLQAVSDEPTVFALPGGDVRTVIRVRKCGATPARYPRRPGLPAKQPL